MAFADRAAQPQYRVGVTGRQWLSEDTFEIRFGRPAGFDPLPGQKITLIDGELRRDYTPLGPPASGEVALCVRLVPNGRVTPRLARAEVGDRFEISAPFGYFTFKPSSRPVVLVATGTGIAPFVAYARAGVRGFDLLHGVRTAADLYYGETLMRAAGRYIPCLSHASGEAAFPGAFAGRVDRCLATDYSGGAYDFYLCGRSEMIRDVMRVIDARFSDSRVYTETFY